MKYSDIKDMSLRDISNKKRELLEELFHGRIKNKMGQLGDPLLVRKKRRILARIQTVFSFLRHAKLSQQKGTASSPKEDEYKNREVGK